MYARRAKAVFTVFPQTLKLRAREIVRTGNPSIFKDASPRTEACKYFGLDAGSPVVAVLGGSQGAKAINNSLVSALPEFAKRGWQVIWGVGAVDFDRLEKDGTLAKTAKEFPGVKPYRFIDRMDLLFSACDAVVNRSGVTTITEMIHFGTPSVLYSHQELAGQSPVPQREVRFGCGGGGDARRGFPDAGEFRCVRR
jgi:UDP-N-acetylglucosamine--N-acetylmuramyl-(pentapeptide) pyrophosphoryl-undecaprenol N-acetylglucosamine transferase